MKAATRVKLAAAILLHISIHAAREGGDFVAGNVSGIGSISIHAAREGGDGQNPRRRFRAGHFNPRRP